MRRNRRSSPGSETDRDRWLVSYADFITLLFAFFVVMYSISSVNEGKYKVLSESLEGIFNTRQKTVKPIQIGEVSPRTEYGEKGDILIKPFLEFKEDITEKEKQEQNEELEKIAGEFEDSFEDLIYERDIDVRLLDNWIEISLKGSAVFESGGVIPAETAFPIIQNIARVLKSKPNGILVEGHTDNVPTRSDVYPTNWELSAARAATFVRLLSIEGIEEGRMAAAGFGEFKPLVRNDTPEGRNKNRRVVLLISKTPDIRKSLLN
jgi:chemotaxis protein MotB